MHAYREYVAPQYARVGVLAFAVLIFAGHRSFTRTNARGALRPGLGQHFDFRGPCRLSGRRALPELEQQLSSPSFAPHRRGETSSASSRRVLTIACHRRRLGLVMARVASWRPQPMCRRVCLAPMAARVSPIFRLGRAPTGRSLRSGALGASVLGQRTRRAPDGADLETEALFEVSIVAAFATMRRRSPPVSLAQQPAALW